MIRGRPQGPPSCYSGTFRAPLPPAGSSWALVPGDPPWAILVCSKPCVEAGEVFPLWCGLVLLGQGAGDRAGPWLCREGNGTGHEWGPQPSPASVSPDESSFRFPTLALGIGTSKNGRPWRGDAGKHLGRACSRLCALPRALVPTCDCFAPQGCFPQSASGTGCWAPGEPLGTDRAVSVLFSTAVGFRWMGTWQLLVTIVVIGASLRSWQIPFLPGT